MGKEFLPELDEMGFMVHIADLKKSYSLTLAYWQDRKRRLLEELQQNTSVAIDDLKKKRNRQERRRLREEYPVLHAELEECKAIISDLNYCINWMSTGKRPGSSRGIERRSVWQRTSLMDPIILQNYANQTNSRSCSTLTDEQIKLLSEALELLSEQERECYVMAHGQGISLQQIAIYMGLEKGTVQRYVDRAHSKVSRGWQRTLF